MPGALPFRSYMDVCSMNKEHCHKKEKLSNFNIFLREELSFLINKFPDRVITLEHTKWPLLLQLLFLFCGKKRVPKCHH